MLPIVLSFGVALWATGASFPPSMADAVRAGMMAVFPGIMVVGMLLTMLAMAIRKKETANIPQDIDPDRAAMAEMMRRENSPDTVQNHMFSITTRQTGLLRRLTLLFGFHVIVVAGKLGLMRAGFLANIGTIHSARWVVLPGTRRVVFVSNYDGSWESYLEDFITKAAMGATGVWGNTIGFPITRLLFWKGVEDGDRFKRFARHSMKPTAFWYSAYPKLTGDHIRKQAIVVSGLRNCTAIRNSPSDAEAWLDLFGSIPRPEYGLEYEEIQTLMFGGFKSHHASTCLVINFGDGAAPEDQNQHRYADVQLWLSEQVAFINFGDKPTGEFVRNIAFSASGLRKLGLDRELAINALAEPATATDPQGFPAVFALGMGHESRKHLLRDPADLKWCDDEADAVVLLYASTESAEQQFETVGQKIEACGMRIVKKINTRLNKFSSKDFSDTWTGKSMPGEKKGDTDPGRSYGKDELGVEPFGFVDGISQPKVRGFPGKLGAHEPLHSVEPGEFILGYKDNRGFFPPSPQIDRDLSHIGMHAQRILPSSPADQPQRYPAFAPTAMRDFGRNGSYLVIRQLAQDVNGFNNQIALRAAELENDSLNPYVGKSDLEKTRTREWLAAKMVGRWRNGSSLVEHPFAPQFMGAATERMDNSFLFKDADPQGKRCPFGAHIRRAFPRDSLDTDNIDELSVTNRHRLLRRGRPYVDETSSTAQGTLFMCFNADLERQFEFVQQTWVGSPSFHGLDGEVDPMVSHNGGEVGPGENDNGRLTIPGPAAPLCIGKLQSYVELLGGGYFFMPGRHALWFLAGQSWYDPHKKDLLLDT